MTNDQRDDARSRLILALDAPTMESGLALLDRVKGHIGIVKVGLELFTASGPAVVSAVREVGFDVFLDLKLHDIPNTVAGAVRAVNQWGVSMLTVHTAGGSTMLSRAVSEADRGIRILGVTLLTSLGEEDLEPAAIHPNPGEVVRRRAELAARAGCGGIVCSPKEIGMVRQTVGREVAIVTPGIRPSGTADGDQKRIATPGAAISSGADYLVIGRAISQAPDPAAAAEQIVDEIERSLTDR